MKKIKGLITIVCLLCLFGYIGYQIINRTFTNHLLMTEGVYIKAVIIDEKNFMGNSPVSHEYCYSYLSRYLTNRNYG